MSENIQITEEELLHLTPKDHQKNAVIDMVKQEVGLNIGMQRMEHDSIERTEQIIPPAVTRFIDLIEKDEKTGAFDVRKDEFGNPLDIMGALGNIPASQMPFIRLSNFNNIWVKLNEGIYLDIYKTNENGELELDAKGEPIRLYRKVIDIGTINKKLQLFANLAYEYRTAKLQGQVMVGNAGGSPLGVGGSWDNTLDLLFGGGKKEMNIWIKIYLMALPLSLMLNFTYDAITSGGRWIINMNNHGEYYVEVLMNIVWFALVVLYLKEIFNIHDSNNYNRHA